MLIRSGMKIFSDVTGNSLLSEWKREKERSYTMNSPAEIAKNYVNIGKGKVNTPVPKMFILAMMAGMFIAMAGVGASTASCTVENASLGKLVGAAVFPGGLAMVLIAGSELFTGNTLLLIPLIAGVSYEFIRLAGRSDNAFVNLLSKPGLWLQGLTTKEPDDEMIEVGIASVEAVFDWKSYVEEIRREKA